MRSIPRAKNGRPTLSLLGSCQKHVQISVGGTHFATRLFITEFQTFENIKFSQRISGILINSSGLSKYKFVSKISYTLHYFH